MRFNFDMKIIFLVEGKIQGMLMLKYVFSIFITSKTEMISALIYRVEVQSQSSQSKNKVQ